MGIDGMLGGKREKCVRQYYSRISMRHDLVRGSNIIIERSSALFGGHFWGHFGGRGWRWRGR
jgi:hypothetical protein